MADTNKAIEDLRRENIELSGMMLATGVILTQLLQSICKRELNPQAAAGRIKGHPLETHRLGHPVGCPQRVRTFSCHAATLEEANRQRKAGRLHGIPQTGYLRRGTNRAGRVRSPRNEKRG